jgi:hypothetical protein
LEFILRKTLRIAWDRINIIGSIIGDVQGHLIALVFYFSILVPFGITSRLFSDPLRIRMSSQDTSSWIERPQAPEDLDSARLQG